MSVSGGVVELLGGEEWRVFTCSTVKREIDINRSID